MTAIEIYRLAQSLYLKHVPVLPKILYRLIHHINICHLYYETSVWGGGLYLPTVGLA